LTNFPVFLSEQRILKIIETNENYKRLD
jgi:hypothetical protein